MIRLFKKKYTPVNILPMENILICRANNIGDLVVTLPMIKLIKQQWPQCKVNVLAGKYTQSIIAMCPDIDTFINWDEINNLPHKQASLKIKKLQCDVAIHANPFNLKMASIIYRSGIKIRIGRGGRISKRLLFSHRIPNKKFLNKHEAQLTIDLLAPLGIKTDIPRSQLASMINLKIPPMSKKIAHLLNKDRFNIILHPFSNGHAREWPIAYYTELAKQLDPTQYKVFVTGSAKEHEKLKDSSLMDVESIENTCGKLNLAELVILLKHVDGVIVGSTGPLHLAAAAETHVLGLFPKQHGISITRWGPLGKHAISTTCSMPCPGCSSDNDCACMRAINVAQVRQVIRSWEAKTVKIKPEAMPE